MLDTLLDINQIDAGVVHATIVDVPVGPLMERLHHEFALHAEAKGLSFHVVGSTCIVRSDPALLEQMLRNLISNALKYTVAGSVLLGCRRRGRTLRIEVWDTGIGIPADKTDAVFEEYHQIDNPARERSRGLGLGLPIVRRLGDLIGHPVHLRSWYRRGSVFSIELPLSLAPAAPPDGTPIEAEPSATGRTGAILLVDDEPDVCALLAEYLTSLGHRVVTALDGPAAIDLMARGAIKPDLVLADYNLPGPMNGLQLGTKLRDSFGASLPVVILTGDISTATLVDVAAGQCVKLNKPVQLNELADILQRLLPARIEVRDLNGIVFVVDDDAAVREQFAALLRQEGRRCTVYASAEAFLEAYRPGPGQCLVVKARLPGLGGLDLLRQMRDDGNLPPAIVITRSSDIGMVVEAMKAGAIDFLEKPVTGAALLDCVARALDLAHGTDGRLAWERQAVNQLSTLTPRQREIMAMVLDGHPSKNIAADLNISQRTVENHRAAIMHKTGSASLPALARLAVAAAGARTKANGTQPTPRLPEPA
jgi:two-component system CheB/CheR fusion protein